jgi:hypothetical protein
MAKKKSLKIDRGIPAPPDPRDKMGKYPYQKMRVGDSFYVDGVTSNEMCRRSYYWSVILKSRYTCRTIRDGRKVGTRVWRIA